MSAFPQTLHVEIRTADDGELCFYAEEALEAHAEVGKKIVVGVYELVELLELEFKIATSKVGEPRP